jgi:hypothetical protein
MVTMFLGGRREPSVRIVDEAERRWTGAREAGGACLSGAL